MNALTFPLIIVAGIAIVAIFFMCYFYKCYQREVAEKCLEKQGRLLYEIQNHTEPFRLESLYKEYISNLEDPDIESFVLRAKEAISRNIRKGGADSDFARRTYAAFFEKIKDNPIVKSRFDLVLLNNL